MQRNVKFVNPERGDLRVLQATSEVRPLEIATDRTVKLSLEQKEAICRSCPTQWFHAYLKDVCIPNAAARAQKPEDIPGRNLSVVLKGTGGANSPSVSHRPKAELVVSR